MKQKKAVDYQRAIAEFNKDEHAPNNPVHTDKDSFKTPMTNTVVDYQAASRAWDQKQAGKYTIYTTEQEDEGKL